MYIVSTLQAARVACMLLQLLTATVEAAKYKLAILHFSLNTLGYSDTNTSTNESSITLLKEHLKQCASFTICTHKEIRK